MLTPWLQMNCDRARVRIRGPGSREPRRKSGAASRHRPSRKSRLCPSPGRNEEPDLYAVATCTKVRPYLTLPRYQTAAKDFSDPLERFRFASGCDPEARSLSRGYDYFFFEVFFATFLVAAFAVFFAFFAFLAMSSSVKNGLSEHAHAVHRHAQH